MKTYIEARTLLNQTVTAILSFLTIGILGSFVESLIGTMGSLSRTRIKLSA